MRWVKHNTEESSALLLQALETSPPQQKEYESLLYYAATYGSHIVIKIVVKAHSKNCVLPQHVIHRLINTAAISSYGQSPENQHMYRELVDFLFEQISRHSLVSMMNTALKVLTTQGNLEMYKHIIKNKNIKNTMREPLKYSLLKNAAAYGHFEFVIHLTSEYPDILDWSAVQNTYYSDYRSKEHPIFAATQYGHKDIAYYLGKIDTRAPENTLNARERSKKRLVDYLLKNHLKKEYTQALVHAIFFHIPMYIEKSWEKPLRKGELGSLYRDLSQHFYLPKINFLSRTCRALARIVPPIVPEIEHPPLVQIYTAQL